MRTNPLKNSTFFAVLPRRARRARAHFRVRALELDGQVCRGAARLEEDYLPNKTRTPVRESIARGGECAGYNGWVTSLRPSTSQPAGQ